MSTSKPNRDIYRRLTVLVRMANAYADKSRPVGVESREALLALREELSHYPEEPEYLPSQRTANRYRIRMQHLSAEIVADLQYHGKGYDF